MKDYKKEFREKFGHKYLSGVYIQTTMEAIEPIEAFIESLLAENRESIVKEIEQNIDIWFEVHDKQNKSFQSDDLIKYLRNEKL